MVVEERADGVVRFATFNIALNRRNAGELISELESGDSEDAKKIAEVIQRVRPDVLLINEIDYDKSGKSLKLFNEKYLAVPQNGQPKIEFNHTYTASVNTGIDSGFDLNDDGETGKAEDAFGYGFFPGQYGMAILSRHEIDYEQIRTFQEFLWKDMPDALVPQNQDGGAFYSDEAWNKVRLSSKSHWDVPIKIGDSTIHFLAAHPTPPVFDGPEDRNGKRNHDEIRLLADYVSGAEYIVDDDGNKGGLAGDSMFIVAGDMNADPNDGDSTAGAGKILLEHQLINSENAPRSKGATQAATESGEMNADHRGNAAYDTGDFNDETVGNLRIDYVLPSKNLELVASGVFWPAKNESGYELNDASDHHLVWIDIQLKAE